MMKHQRLISQHIMTNHSSSLIIPFAFSHRADTPAGLHHYYLFAFAIMFCLIHTCSVEEMFLVDGWCFKDL